MDASKKAAHGRLYNILVDQRGPYVLITVAAKLEFRVLGVSISHESRSFSMVAAARGVVRSGAERSENLYYVLCNEGACSNYIMGHSSC